MPTVLSTNINRPMERSQELVQTSSPFPSLKDLVRASSPLPHVQNTVRNRAPGAPAIQAANVAYLGQPINPVQSVNQRGTSRLNPTAQCFLMGVNHSHLKTAEVNTNLDHIKSVRPPIAPRAMLSNSANQTTAYPVDNGIRVMERQLSIDDDGFKPTTMVTYGPGVQRPANLIQGLYAAMTNMSPNYRGDPATIANYNQIDLPDRLNCSFWISKLPVDVTLREILEPIRGCGRVYAIHINQGEAHRVGHAACKLVFMDVEGATNFYVAFVVPQALVVREQKAFICRNRNKVAEQLELKTKPNSRCLEATGPEELVNTKFLFDYFDRKFVYEIDEVVNQTIPQAGRKRKNRNATLEIRFGSYRAQAVFAFKILRESPVFKNAGVKVKYVKDPCE